MADISGQMNFLPASPAGHGAVRAGPMLFALPEELATAKGELELAVCPEDLLLTPGSHLARALQVSDLGHYRECSSGWKVGPAVRFSRLSLRKAERWMA